MRLTDSDMLFFHGKAHGNNLNLKERKNHRIYIKTLRSMSPEERLLKCFELTEFARNLFLHGLRKRFPDLSENEIRNIYLERLNKCHNRNY